MCRIERNNLKAPWTLSWVSRAGEDDRGCKAPAQERRKEVSAPSSSSIDSSLLPRRDWFTKGNEGPLFSDLGGRRMRKSASMLVWPRSRPVSHLRERIPTA
ncbi:ketoreductase [Sesbania bispinosa]|nr:ketoreductase [Sesbania bispinosa]